MSAFAHKVAVEGVSDPSLTLLVKGYNYLLSKCDRIYFIFYMFFIELFK